MPLVARVGDTHACPQKGHSVNTIATGSCDVVINGIPAARVGDTTACGSTIVAGSSTVFINGKPAAVMGSATSHGGIIIGGSGNVLIGDSFTPTPTIQNKPARRKNENQDENYTSSKYVEDTEKTKILKVTNIFWSYGDEEYRLSDISRHSTDVNLHIETTDFRTGDSVDITIEITNDDSEKETITLNAFVDEQGKAVIKNAIANNAINIVSEL